MTLSSSSSSSILYVLEHEVPTNFLQAFLSWAIQVSSFLGLSHLMNLLLNGYSPRLLLFPGGAHLRALFGCPVLSILSVCPSHLHFIFVSLLQQCCWFLPYNFLHLWLATPIGSLRFFFSISFQILILYFLFFLLVLHVSNT